MPGFLIPRRWPFPLRAAVAPVLTALIGLAAPSAWAQSGSVQRSEGKDGRVTYSNTQCPDGTVPVRKVNTDPPISVEARKAAQEQAKKDAAAVKELERERAQEAARERKQADARAKTEAKAEAKTAQRCERAQRDLQRARQDRSELARQAATAEKMQSAEQEVGRREATVARECGR